MKLYNACLFSDTKLNFKQLESKGWTRGKDQMRREYNGLLLSLFHGSANTAMVITSENSLIEFEDAVEAFRVMIDALECAESARRSE